MNTSSPIPPKPSDIDQATPTGLASPIASQASFKEKLLASEQVIEIEMDHQEEENMQDLYESPNSENEGEKLASRIKVIQLSNDEKDRLYST